MHLNAHVDLDLVAVEQPDELNVLLEITAPAPPPSEARAAATVQVVLDRSGSMSGERLEASRAALIALVDRLDPEDAFGLVAFDDTARVVVPAGPLADKAPVKQAIARLAAGTATNLSGGLLRGIQEARRCATKAGAMLLLISDGHANAGLVDRDGLAGVAATARRDGVTISTIGVGLDYDEELLAAIARGGQGGHAFALDGDAAAGAVAGELEGLLSKTVQAASLTILPAGPVEGMTVWNDLPTYAIAGGAVAELGDLWDGEQRKVLLTLAVPATPELGLAQIATLGLTYVTLPELVEQTITIPLHVNVVPGDAAAGRIPDAKVRSEMLFQRAQEAKRRAAGALQRGDIDAAHAEFRCATAAFAAAPAGDAELAREALVLRHLDEQVAAGHAALVAKASMAEHARKARKRGRRA